MSPTLRKLFMRPSSWLLSSALLTAPHAGATGAVAPVQQVVSDPEFSQLVAAGARVELLTDQAKWAEGPLCLADGHVIWSDIKSNKVNNWQVRTGVSTWLEPADYQNGHTLDGQGLVVAASHGKRGIVRQESNGEWRTLVDTYQGKRLNSPNDVVADKNGNLWFSDPTFGVLSKSEGNGGTPEQGGEFLYRYGPDTGQITRLDTPEVHSPNGLAFSPDQQLLYVADSQLAHDFTNKNLAHRIMVYQVRDRHLINGKLFANIESGIPDGIKVDALGNVWSSSKEGIQVFSSAGKLLGKLLVDAKDTSNLTFCSSAQGSWIYVTAANNVLRVEVAKRVIGH
ncbi:SMP-30/gluconolactonase/LRE family protein [Pseudomonas sp. KU26590]|uniref:SMP-30/gluconolactonase/LRE family protein n=1 Tax=Pseudomonas sp. KU26590 TaxID=2991051 RepID=UPI00223DD064|nr:SMP-30/gluconolactonase/LRE family protein [Pseudomonas sp. KU26590]UZJ59452.1 SMP-30/gluconolactonase/LRE family protein [Pseudomonas sp. KU26590]